MGREQGRRLFAAKVGHVAPEGDTFLRCIAGGGHQMQAHDIGFALVVSAEGQGDPDVCAQAQHAQELFTLDIADKPENHQRDADAQLLRHAFIAVPGEDVAHFVADDRGDLVMVVGDLQQAAMDTDVAARQGEGIGFRVVKDSDLPSRRRRHGAVDLGDRSRDMAGDAMHLLHLRPFAQRPSLLLHLGEGSAAQIGHG